MALFRYRVTAYRRETKLGQCVVFAECPESAETIARVDLAEELQLNLFDLGVRYVAQDVLDEMTGGAYGG